MLREVGCSYGCSMTLCHIHMLRSKKLVLNVASAGTVPYVCGLSLYSIVCACVCRTGGSHTVSQRSHGSPGNSALPGDKQGGERKG